MIWFLTATSKTGPTNKLLSLQTMLRTTATWVSVMGLALLATSTTEAAAPSREHSVAIGSGRRLFLDDRLLDLSRCRDVTRVLNPPCEIQRVLRPDRPWESLGFIFYANVLEDSKEVKLYYTAYEWKGGDLGRHSCLATSSDGVHFERARLGKKEYDGDTWDVNFVYPTAIEGSVFLDPQAPAEQGYRMILTGKGGLYTATSADGIQWDRNPACLLPFIPDSQHTAFWDNQLRKYVVYLRTWAPKRSVCRVALDNLDTPWPYDTSVPPFHIWGKDKPPTLSRELPVVLAPDEKDPENVELYTSVVMPYPFADEAYLAFPAAYLRLKGPEWEHCSLGGSDGLFEVQFAASADGITWERWRKPYVATGYRGDLNLRLVSMAPGLVRRGRWLYQYFVGWPHTHGQMGVWRKNPAERNAWMKKDKGGIYLAKQRLDGFVSMDSAYTGGVLTTRLLTFTGNRLVLNLDTHGTGNAKVALADAAGKPISGFTLDDCLTIQTDDTDCVVRWKGGADVSALEGQPVRVRIEMRNTKVYALQFQRVEEETPSRADVGSPGVPSTRFRRSTPPIRMLSTATPTTW